MKSWQEFFCEAGSGLMACSRTNLCSDFGGFMAKGTHSSPPKPRAFAAGDSPQSAMPLLRKELSERDPRSLPGPAPGRPENMALELEGDGPSLPNAPRVVAVFRKPPRVAPGGDAVLKKFAVVVVAAADFVSCMLPPRDSEGAVVATLS